MSLLISLFTFVLVLASVLLVLIVLMQKAKNDGGMGAALGGGATEATFGADTGNVLTGWTIKLTVAFFVLSLGLYLGHIHLRHQAELEAGSALPEIEGAAMPDFAPATEAALENEEATVVAPDLDAPAADAGETEGSEEPSN